MELKRSTIAVTGASGMLGVYICRALLREGAKVRGVVRNPEKAAFLGKEGVTFAKADLADRKALTEAFRGADAVVSNAALYQVTNLRWKDNFNTNIEGTTNVYEAMGAAGVKRAVQISSFGVYRFKPYKRINENDAVLDGKNRQGGAYRATKQLSEEVARDFAQKYGIELTILRPSGIYGARDTNMMPYLYAVMKSPLLPVPTAAFPLVYAADVAMGVAGALRNDASAGKDYNVGGNDLSFVEFAKGWKEAAGKGPAIVPLPVPLRFRIDNTRAEKELGFTNRSFAEGLREVFAEEGKLS